VSIKVVQEHLGHASAKVTLDVYGHLMPSDEDRSRKAIDVALGRALRTR
jgi:integrase